jgi:hypothetical protein
MELLRAKSLLWAKKSTRYKKTGKDDDILKIIEEVTQKIFAKNGDIRYARNYGIFAGAFLWAFGNSIPDKREFMQFLTSNAYSAKLEIDSAHPMAEFFNDFPDMIAKGFIVRDRDFTLIPEIGGSTGLIGIRVRECHKGWCDYKRGEGLTERTLRDYIKKEPFFHSEDRVYYPSAGRFRSVIVNTDRMKMEFEDFCEVVLRSTEDEPF